MAYPAEYIPDGMLARPHLALVCFAAIDIDGVVD